MYTIQTLNKISPAGLDRLPREEYEIASEIPRPDAVILRSFKMHGMEIPDSVKAVARAGAGTNNIPIPACTERGIPVFNTPGANANSVKELVIAGLLLSSRRLYRGIRWAEGLIGKGEEVPKLVEKEKSRFAGPELMGKKMGVIGLGAIGVSVANAAEDLKMEVTGYDPFISIDAAWGLSRKIHRAQSLDHILAESDFISLHVPLNSQTRGMINAERLKLMKPGARILNFARGGLVVNEDIIAVVKTGHIDRYVTDFPDEELLKTENVIAVPHLGASTPEAEDNCAVMAAEQLRDFLEQGNIRNSVNFPACTMEFSGDHRLLIANRNIPNMVGQISTILAEENINIQDMLNRHREEIAYNIIDTDSPVTPTALEKIHGIDGVLMTRQLKSPE